MLNVQRICFLGTRTGNFEATSAFFRDVLGLHSVHTEAGWSIFDLPSGRSDFVEVFGPEHENANVFPAEVSEGIVVAFAVDDIAAARRGTVGQCNVSGKRDVPRGSAHHDRAVRDAINARCEVRRRRSSDLV